MAFSISPISFVNSLILGTATFTFEEVTGPRPTLNAHLGSGSWSAVISEANQKSNLRALATYSPTPTNPLTLANAFGAALTFNSVKVLSIPPANYSLVSGTIAVDPLVFTAVPAGTYNTLIVTIPASSGRVVSVFHGFSVTSNGGNVQLTINGGIIHL